MLKNTYFRCKTLPIFFAFNLYQHEMYTRFCWSYYLVSANG